MTFNKRQLLVSAGICALTLTTVHSALAQTWPQRPIKMIVTAPPGGTADYLARVVADRMGKQLNQSVIIDNRAGASGMLGADLVAKAAPDGYTLLLTEGASLAINTTLRKDLPFNPTRDLLPVSLLATTPSILVAGTAFPASNVKELVGMAKQGPGAVSYATPGVGTPHHLAGAMLSKMAGIQMNHVPYKGGGAVITDVVSGQVPLLFTGVLGPLPFLKSGKLKAIAIGSRQRSPQLPDVPTFAESGYPDFEAEVFFGAFLPAKVPQNVVDVMSSAINAAMADPDVRKKLGEQALSAVGSTPQQLESHFAKETAKWAGVIKSSGVTLE
ncbi:MAG: tripartite tricarboxylate transporter substrate binding protein [Polaromonas sp.]|nr:tripartite tricarboxylate transporter substrate binding protein [Polaromonas sp.]